MKKHLKRSWGWSGHPTNLQIKQIKGGEMVAGESSRCQGQGAKHNAVSAKSVANE